MFQFNRVTCIVHLPLYKRCHSLNQSLIKVFQLTILLGEKSSIFLNHYDGIIANGNEID